MTCHPWCSDIARDEKVRADEDRRSFRHLKLEECFLAVAIGATIIPKAASGSSSKGPENPETAWPANYKKKTTMVLLECDLYESLHPEAWDWADVCMKSGMVIMPGESIKVVPPRHNGTELGELLRSAQVTIPQELKPLDPQCQKYAAGWNDCLHNVKAMLAGKITVNQQTGTMKVRSEDFRKDGRFPEKTEEAEGIPSYRLPPEVGE
jgi:hypothetical protein